ncbi:MAG: biopolymer transporter ExbD [Candidatus Riflebacteria bacterium]|nr:biopolymer transporter ExbD [Candidatus Riflebacteria bacterium]
MSLARKPRKETFSLDLTTCSDIIFTLLLFYILTQNFIPQIPLDLPRIENANYIENNTHLKIDVLESGNLRWNETEFSIDSVPDFRITKDKPVIIFAHKMAPSGVCIELLDKLRAMGITSVSFAGTIKEKK